MTRSRSVVRAAVAALLVASALPSDASKMLQNTGTGAQTAGFLVDCNDAGGFAHWTTAQTSWFLNTANQGSGKATALQNAMASWTNVPNAAHVLTYSGTTTAGFAVDGQNSVVWSAGNGCTGNCLALTQIVLQQPGQVIIESDITFNNNASWSTNGTNNDTQAVVTHELGHALGIHHTDLTTTVPEPTMLSTYVGGTGQRSLEPDDVGALQCSQSRYCVGAVGAPAVPASLTVEPLLCYGWNDVEWSASPGATYYELYRSSTATFTTQALEYSGPDLYKLVNVPGTRYLRVRACNASGCSCYRRGNRAATRTNGCL